MKKIMIIIPALVFGASLAIAAELSDFAQSIADLQASRVEVNRLPTKTRADRLARQAAIDAWDAANAATVEAAIPQIDALIAERPNLGGFVIWYHLGQKNKDATAAKIAWQQNPEDRALAAKLLAVSSHAHNYIRRYATAAEIAALPGSSGVSFATAVVGRAAELGQPELVTDYYTRCLAKGLITTGYNAWFDQKLIDLAAAGKEAEGVRLARVEALAVNKLKTTPAQEARLVKLRAAGKLSGE
ncbi:hypothetical protein OPIT5_29260 [Opitutaceae bacterium TAV5]|nr:hypothetical protein OPIT5_21860 [Opitutaceae bacterium TAV5]AHF93676.1 hypothetical protein OPIT5_29260 [Opitutaceae bacterium TAV5]